MANFGNQIATPRCLLLTIIDAREKGKTRLAVDAANAELLTFTVGVVFDNFEQWVETAVISKRCAY